MYFSSKKIINLPLGDDDDVDNRYDDGDGYDGDGYDDDVVMMMVIVMMKDDDDDDEDMHDYNVSDDVCDDDVI